MVFPCLHPLGVCISLFLSSRSLLYLLNCSCRCLHNSTSPPHSSVILIPALALRIPPRGLPGRLPRLIQIREPRVLQRIMGANPQLRTQLQHALQQINATRVDLRQDGAQVLRVEDLEVRLVLRELADTRPRALRRRAHDAEDANQLVLIGGAGEQRTARVHLRHDAAGGPDVDAGVVGARAEEDVGRAVPQRHDLVGEGVDWDAKGARKTEITELELSLGVDEEVLRLQVTM